MAITITNPKNGETISGTVTVSVNATGYKEMDFYVDGVLKGRDRTSAPQPFKFSWFTNNYNDGSHTLKVVGVNNWFGRFLGRLGVTGPSVIVNVKNVVPAPTPTPTPSPTPTPTPSKTWNKGQGGFQEGTYTFQAAYKNFDVFMSDLNGTKAPSDLPGVRTLLYLSSVSINKDFNTGIPWATANSNGWLLKDSAGNYLLNSGYTNNNILDFSKPAATQALANQAVAWAKQYGFKGIWFDDVVATGTFLCNALPAGWTQAQWYSNLVAHVRRLSSIIRSAGFEVVCNANGYIPGNMNSDNGLVEIAFWTDLIAPAAGDQVSPTGFCPEYWEEISATQVRVNREDVWSGHWQGWRDVHTFCQKHGVDFLPISYAANSSVANFLYGTFMLDYDGGTSAATIGDSGVPYTFKYMGAALGAATVNGNMWTRRFENGTVTVDSVAGTATIV